MNRVEEEHYIIDFDMDERIRRAIIKPKGFWGDMVKVWQSQNIRDSTWKKPEISWSCGGTDGSLSNLGSTLNFIAALKKATEIAQEWEEK